MAETPLATATVTVPSGLSYTAYPLSELEAIKGRGQAFKVVHFIRHAQGAFYLWRQIFFALKNLVGVMCVVSSQFDALPIGCGCGHIKRCCNRVVTSP